MRMQQVKAALPFAYEYITNALDTLELRDSSARDTYRTWFGTLTPKRLQLVKSHFIEMTKNNFTEYKYFCESSECNPQRYAYVDSEKFGEVHLCDRFFKASPDGANSRASTLVHEASHFQKNGGTGDNEPYGEGGALELARNAPDVAIMNADNHEYFAVTAFALLPTFVKQA
ncbi:hypothetical protein C8Q79DRAFT_646340 [Trametes meyenii]|nr:hypothetical protein C8Q79DRAFT_646340 [Trametes meyenii]